MCRARPDVTRDGVRSQATLAHRRTVPGVQPDWSEPEFPPGRTAGPELLAVFMARPQAGRTNPMS